MNQEEKFEELAKQLKNPFGEKGLQVAQMMSDTNTAMTLNTVDLLNLRPDDLLLELGHGNCQHLKNIFERETDIKYHGLEVSDLMHIEAKRINQEYIKLGKAFFHKYEGGILPFAKESFEKIFSVNTIYFWNDTPRMFDELFRVLRRFGILNVTFAEKIFMTTLPFSRFGFTLYGQEEVIEFALKSGFKHLKTQIHTESIQSKSGDIVNRKYLITSFLKPE